MIDNGKTITVNYENLPYIDLEKFDNLSVNLNLRNSSVDESLKLMEDVLSRFSKGVMKEVLST